MKKEKKILPYISSILTQETNNLKLFEILSASRKWWNNKENQFYPRFGFFRINDILLFLFRCQKFKELLLILLLIFSFVHLVTMLKLNKKFRWLLGKQQLWLIFTEFGCKWNLHLVYVIKEWKNFSGFDMKICLEGKKLSFNWCLLFHTSAKKQ